MRASAAHRVSISRVLSAEQHLPLCEFIEFDEFMGVQRAGADREGAKFAADPNEWFRRLKDDGVHALRLSHGPTKHELGGKNVTERMLAGSVGGGGRWLIEAVKATTSDLWEARWEVGDKNRADQKIWRVVYAGSPSIGRRRRTSRSTSTH